MAGRNTNRSRKLDDDIAGKKSELARLKREISEAKRAANTSVIAGSPNATEAEPTDARVSDHPLSAYADELEREIDSVKDSLIDMRTERDLVLKALSEVVKDATRFGYFVREEVGDADPTSAGTLGPIAGRLQFFLDAMPRALAEAGVSAPELLGLDYQPGLTVEALNLDEFGPNDKLVIVDVVEPLLTYTPRNVDVSDESERIRLRVGKVLVAKKDQ